MLIRAAKLALRSTAYLNKGSLPHVVQMPFFKASALEMNYPGLDHVVTELLLHHRGSEVVVYAFDHEQSLTESPTAGALMFLHAKFTALRLAGCLVTLVPLTSWDELMRLETEAVGRR